MNLNIFINHLKFKNPVMVASGTFGYGQEFADLVELKDLGALITKTITLDPRPGNAPPRLVETSAGMLNSVGLQNEGVDDFISFKWPKLKKIGTKVIVSISATNAAEFVQLAECLEDAGIEAIEMNLSCPNIEHIKLPSQKNTPEKKYPYFCSPRMFAQNKRATFEIVHKVRKKVRLVLLVKLSPNVTDIASIAKAAEDGGADAVSLVNTFLAMAVDVSRRRAKLANVTGGLSGPAIKPIALRMVYEVYKRVNIPVVGMGGIMNAEDALEFFIAGATAICVGTANFVNPRTANDILAGLKKYLYSSKINDINRLIGSLSHET